MEIYLWNVCFQRCLAAPTNLSTYSNGVSRFDFELIFNNKVNNFPISTAEYWLILRKPYRKLITVLAKNCPQL